MTKYTGLTMTEVRERQLKYGKNEITIKKSKKWMKMLKHIATEPIYILLFCSAMIYFVLGAASDGIIMMGFVLFVVGIDIIQDARTGVTLKKLKILTTPKVLVIRDGKESLVSSEELVPGDYIIVYEGVKIPADGYIISATGLSMDESILTGETQGVWKETVSDKLKINEIKSDGYFRKDYCYNGTMVLLGNATIEIDKIGNETEYGKIVHLIAKVSSTPTPLQQQMSKVAFQCTCAAIILFILVGLATFHNLFDFPISIRIIQSILAGIVLALSMIPGEFPVIESVFLTMGALRLAKKKALVRRLTAVETLGAITTLCVDKTGTITQNNLMIKETWVNERIDDRLCKPLLLACNKESFDPMEKAILGYCDHLCNICTRCQEGSTSCKSEESSLLIKEYAFTNELKAMGQAWQIGEAYYIAVKGSPETIAKLCIMSAEEEDTMKMMVSQFSNQGLRVIAIADQFFGDNTLIPESLEDCKLRLKGILGLYDPPRLKINENIQVCHQAGIRVIMITGDHPNTAASIAKEIGMYQGNHVITGEMIENLSDTKLMEAVQKCNIFARVLPVHKMRIVNALKMNGEIVAMTGDGVNDSPAQRIADIGIAMGMNGSDVCREAADMILLDNNFSTILDSVKDGRRIYQNIIKTIGYVLAIHIPIALISFIAPLLGIAPDELLLLPLHIILLELIMDPTCSIVLERQPVEDNIMNIPARNSKEGLLSKALLIKSTLQGVMIFFASFLLYKIMLSNYTPSLARTAGFSVLVLSSILLVLVNCSEYDSIFKIISKMRRDSSVWHVNLIILAGLSLIVYSPLNQWLGFEPMPLPIIMIVITLSALSVLWYEIVKLLRRNKIS